MDQAVSSVMKAFGPAKPGYILNRVGIFGCCNCIWYFMRTLRSLHWTKWAQVPFWNGHLCWSRAAQLAPSFI